MITLALAQMLYFFCLQAKFTGGEDGIQAVPRGHLFGFIDLAQTMNLYWLRAGDLRLRLPGDLAHDPLALRSGAEGDPRERAARHLAGLPGRALQAARLRAVGDAVGPGRGDQGDPVPAGDADRCLLGDVGRSDLDDLAGGLGTIFGPVVGAFIIIGAQNYLAKYGSWVTIIQGFIFVVCVLTFRRGVVGELGRYLRRSL